MYVLIINIKFYEDIIFSSAIEYSEFSSRLKNLNWYSIGMLSNEKEVKYYLKLKQIKKLSFMITIY